MKYLKGDFKVGTDVNVVYEEGIDIYTRNRVDEILQSKNITSEVSNEIVEGKTNIIIGINGSGEFVDTYFNKEVKHRESFFDKYDSNIVSVENGVIGVLGNNTDSAFYGVTTLKHVFNQLDNNMIREFKINDYADVAYRGFIEGYYGNPWSNEDRAELMKFGGDYKLNQYIFAPKDDLYHNSKWRELYPEKELEEIKKLAKVGNETKNRYVYSLHPFMYSPIRFNTDENYKADFKLITDKFEQLLEADVRQFGILADDAGVPPEGASTYVKLLDDLTVWLTEKQKDYPDLKTDLVFCPNDYMGNGGSAQLKEVNKAGENVSIVMTGGRIWGEVSEEFTSNFIKNIATPEKEGRAPYLWINWPCSDNSKQHLIMGGNDSFLHPGVTPQNVEGIILNPMQQAEANKSALFAMADYGWNIWESKAGADSNWEDSFKYMDHGTAEDTESSKALREISRHMINQNMDGRVVKLEESLELAPKLNDFKAKYESGASIKDDANALIEEFNKLKEAAIYYKENPGNERVRDQIIYWLKCWEDTVDAATGYLRAAIAIEDGDNDKIWLEYSNAQTAFEKSKSHGFNYIDHDEYAEVGVQHIVPFIRFMGQNLSNEVGSIVDPNKVIKSYITNRTDAPSGSLENVLDNNPATEVVYKSPSTIDKGTYVGIKYSSQVELNNVQFLMGTASNPRDTMSEAKIQYTEYGKNWIDLSEEIYTLPSDVMVENLNLKVKGVRLIATADKGNSWLGVRDIIVNKKDVVEEVVETYETTASISDNLAYPYGGNISIVVDGNNSTGVDLSKGPRENEDPDKDTTPVDAYVMVDLGEVKEIGEITFLQADGDKISEAELEYTVDGENWISLGSYNNESEIKKDCSGNSIRAKAIRVRNNAETRKWWKVYEFTVKAPTNKVDTSTPITPSVIKSDSFKLYNGTESNLLDNSDSTDVHYDVDNAGKPDTTIVGDYIGVDLGRSAYVGDIHFVVGRNGSGDKWRKYKLEYSTDNINWTTYKEYEGKDVGQDIIDESLDGIIARYVRLTNLQEINKWVIFSELSVKEYLNIGTTNNIYTNIDSKIKSVYSNDLTKLVPQKNITLNKGEYIGVKLDRIKDLTEINLNISDNSGLQLQTSMNEIEWSNVNNVKTLEDARFVRLIQLEDKATTFDLNDFEVKSNEVSGISFVSGYTAIYAGSADNAFDGNLSTAVQFGAGAVKDKEILYDLGQTIKLNNIKYTVLDTDLDHIRDAKFQVSTDGTNWVDVMELTRKTEDKDAKPIENGYTHGSMSGGKVPISHSYMEGADLNQDARYLRILFTESYSARWVRINEIILNDGEYIPTVNDPTFVSNPIEMKGFEPSNVRDGDLTTSYRPNTNNGQITSGSFTYRLSEKTNVDKINIIQNGNAISNAKVMARTGYSENGEAIWNELGTLDKSLNEILNTKFDNIYEIKIEWDGIAPNIYEIITINNYDFKNELQTKYNKLVKLNEEKYTTSTFEELTKELENAKKVLEDVNSSKDDINNSIEALINTEKLLTLRATEFESFDEILAASIELKEADYTASTWLVFAEKLEIAKNANEAKNNHTQEQIDKITEELTDAKSKLALQVNGSELQELVDSCNYLEENYTVSTWITYNEVLAKAVEALENKSNMTQEELDAVKVELENAIESLVSIEALKSKINIAEDNLGKDSYTEESWEKYLALINEAKAILVKEDATKEEVSDAEVKAEEAKKVLVEDAINALKAVIEKAKAITNNENSYTEISFVNLGEAIKIAEEIANKEDITDEEATEALKNLR